MAASTPGHPPLVLHDVIAPDRIGARRPRQGLVVTATTSPRTATRDDGLSSLAKLRREAKSRRPSARCDMKAKAGPPNRAATLSSDNYVAPAWKASRNGKRSWNSAFSAHLALLLHWVNGERRTSRSRMGGTGKPGRLKQRVCAESMTALCPTHLLSTHPTMQRYLCLIGPGPVTKVRPRSTPLSLGAAATDPKRSSRPPFNGHSSGRILCT